VHFSVHVSKQLTQTADSEEAGIQLFGDDDKALLIVRAASAVAALTIMFVAKFVINDRLAAVDMLMGDDTISFKSVMQKNPGHFCYILLPCTAAVSNTLTNLVSCY